jgi:hypothetical protein
MKFPKFIDEYEILARYVPTIVTAVPIIILTGMVKKSVWLSLFRDIQWFLVVENISISLIAVLFLMQIQRAVAKYCVEQPLFGNELGFQTTTILLFADTSLSMAMKVRVRKRIKQELGIKLLDSTEETANCDEARRTIRDAIRLVRKRVGKGTMTHRYNMQYGFMRNLVAGTFWGLPTALLCSWLLKQQGEFTGAIVAGVIALVFGILLVVHRPLLRRAAHNYATVLISEFVDQKGDVQ